MKAASVALSSSTRSGPGTDTCLKPVLHTSSMFEWTSSDIAKWLSEQAPSKHLTAVQTLALAETISRGAAFVAFAECVNRLSSSADQSSRSMAEFGKLFHGHTVAPLTVLTFVTALSRYDFKE
jgi:hypothetical protein